MIAREAQTTRPLAVVMAEKVAALRAWAAGRTVPPTEAGKPLGPKAAGRCTRCALPPYG